MSSPYGQIERVFLSPFASSTQGLAVLKLEGGNLCKVAEYGKSLPAVQITSLPKASFLIEPILFEDRRVGSLIAQPLHETGFSDECISELVDLSARLSPIVSYSLHVQLNALDWIYQVYQKLPKGKRDWVGVYWKESFIDPRSLESSDLIVGPYIGPRTPHVRIDLDSGLCGLAIREQRTVLVDDVRSDTRFLACSPETRSEIVIPIRNIENEVVGELDIDSNNIASFNETERAWLEEWVEEFGRSLRA